MSEQAVKSPALTAAEKLSLEMAYVSLHDSCGAPGVDRKGHSRICRRLRGHGDGLHASDYPLFMWTKQGWL